MKWFTNPQPITLEQLKKQYKILAFQHHPDAGGNIEDMQAINNLYNTLFQKLKDIHTNSEGQTYTSNKQTEETPEQFRDIINSLLSLHMIGVNIELIGSFLWISGNTFIYKTEIKTLGFKWSKNKMSWFLYSVTLIFSENRISKANIYGF